MGDEPSWFPIKCGRMCNKFKSTWHAAVKEGRPRKAAAGSEAKRGICNPACVILDYLGALYTSP